jgi:serine/threonine protein phosphatase PrpC
MPAAAAANSSGGEALREYFGLMNPLQRSLVLSGDQERADFDLPLGTASVRLRRSPLKSDHTEDALFIAPIGQDGLVFAVADGVGGSPGGRDAANLVLDSLAAALEGAEAQELQQRIIGAIEQANQQLVDLGRGSATTVAVVEVIGRNIRTYHVGDSEIIVVGQRGKFKLRVVPHSPTGFAVESGLLSEDDAMHHDYRHILLNVVGAASMRVEMAVPLELGLRDTVLVASDGLLDNLYVSEIVERIRCGSLSKAADALVELAVARMAAIDSKAPSKPDDLSLVLFRPHLPKRARKAHTPAS